jgi:anti-anti-sigma regulatory factor
MLMIRRSSNGGVVLSLSGRIEDDDVSELQRLMGLEAAGEKVTLDLQDVTLVGRDAVMFLARCQEERIKLDHCPAYIREWIDRDRGRKS